MSVQAPHRPSPGHSPIPDREGWSSAELEPQAPPRQTVGDRILGLSPRRAGFVAGLLLAILLFVLLAGPIAHLRRRPAEAVAPPPPTTVVWGVRLSDQTLVTLISTPAGKPPMVVAVPTETLVDIPGAAPTIGEAAATPGLLVAAAQATLDARVPHYLFVTKADLSALVDRLGGIEVSVDQPFQSGGQQLGPGPVKLLGADVLAYLEDGQAMDQADAEGVLGAQDTGGDEATSRWEDVLTGLVAASRNAGLWTFPLAQSDDVTLAGKLLAGAHGSLVDELPTTVTDNGLEPDPKGVAILVQQFVLPRTALVRVVVLNGNGEPSLGAQLSDLLSQAGFRVVASQNAGSFRRKETEIVAGTSGFLAAADQVRSLLGAGKVYVGEQPTGIADITVVVGKDFTKG